MKESHVDPVTCIGCGLCVQLAPSSFTMQDDGKSIATVPHGDDENTVQGAIDACPVTAISWKEGAESDAPAAAETESENDAGQAAA